MRIAVAGREGMGGFEMRGRLIAALMGWEVIPLVRGRTPKIKRYDAIVLVKYDLEHAIALRSSCGLLVWDALDAFSQWGKNNQAVPFWRHCAGRIPFDAIIATSPECEAVMREALPSHHVWHLPHSADPRVDPIDWSHDGDVVYWGGGQYIASGVPMIQRACKQLGRRFVLDESKGPWRASAPVSCVLHLRLPPTNSDVARRCKPQIKLANAAAAELPILATNDPCVTTLDQHVRTITPDEATDLESLTIAIGDASLCDPPVDQPSAEEHAVRLDALIRTAI